MNFDEILPILRMDHRVARKIWNKENEEKMYVEQVSNLKHKNQRVFQTFLAFFDGENWNVWNPSIQDLMADDWEDLDSWDWE